MKTRSFLFSCVFIFSAMRGCKDKDADPAPASTLNHLGDKWLITSMDFTLVDQSLGSAGIKNGTRTNAGAFYFNGTQGSFDILIDNIRKEDYFTFSESSSSINITSISQTVGSNNISQYVIVLSGDNTSTTTKSITGTITKQSITGQFVLSGTFNLTKE